MADFKIQIDDEEQGAPVQDVQEATPKTKKVSKSGTRNISKKQKKLLLVVVVILALTGLYFYQTNRINNLRAENQKLSDPQQAATQEAERIKSEVSALIELPNETPTIATVVDVEKLRNQSFFANAQNGDRVLLFASAKKAVLYRPDTKKIIEVAPINLGDDDKKANDDKSSDTTQSIEAQE